MSSIIRATTTSGLQVAPDNSGSLQLQTNGTTTAVTIDTSQNVGIGTASPAKKLHVNSGSTDEIARFESSGNPYISLYTSGVRQSYLYSDATAITLASDTKPLNIYVNGSNYMTFGTNNLERMRIDANGNLLFNSGYGSVETAYGCRAWVNFNGTGTPAIVGSGNISSITDNGAGDYTLNFTNAMSDANYTAVFGQVAGSTSTNNYVQGIRITGSSATGTATTKTTSALRILGRSAAGSSADCEQNNVAIFR